MLHSRAASVLPFLALPLALACSPAETEPKTEGLPDLKPLTNASVGFASPKDGATVSSPVSLVFEAKGAVVRPAGTVEAGTGHHHILIGHGAWPFGEIIPADETHIHYGDGRTQTELELAPGKYELTMQFADFMHRSYGEPLAATIRITVED